MSLLPRAVLDWLPAGGATLDDFRETAGRAVDGACGSRGAAAAAAVTAETTVEKEVVGL
jgi:hypothetical protein